MLRSVLGTAAMLAVITLVFLANTPTGVAQEGQMDALHGEQLFLKYCSACHHELGFVGPPMIDATSYFINAGVPPQAMGTLLQHPVRQRPDSSVMPAFTPDAISDTDLNDIGYYLGIQTPAPENIPQLGSAERGAGLYADNCAICHGTSEEFEGKVLPLAFFVEEMRQGGAPPFVMLAFVKMSSRSGYVKDMPTYSSDELSDADLADIAAYIWSMPAPAIP